MIVPMKKYTFLVYHKEYRDFLEKLQELGILHVNEKTGGELEDESLREKYQLIYRLSTIIKFLEKRKAEKQEGVKQENGLSILEEIEEIRYDSELYTQQLASLEKDIQTVEPWGEFDMDGIEKLVSKGFSLRFFIANSKKFEERWETDYNAFKINEISGQTYFVTVNNQDIDIDVDAEEVKKPEKSISQLNSEIEEVKGILSKTENIFDDFAAKNIDSLKDYREKLDASFKFEKVVLNTTSEAENKLMILEAWAPEETVENINKFLEEEGVYYECDKPTKEDSVPIKLKNNGFSKLFEVIGELYTFPNYKELDLTPFFAPFYMLFFGFCLGDAGYGLLITIGTIIGLFKASPKVKPFLKLGMYLGIATTIMGIVGGTCFGIMFAEESWPWLDSYKNYILDTNQMMMLALALGYIQVIFGMFINAANKAKVYGFKYSISQYGWIIIVMFTIPFYGMASQGIIPAELGNKLALITFIIGGIPAFFYNTPGKNPLLNFGTGLWDSYGIASGLLGDVLSYIRLFALGISSAILGNVFNTLAVDLSPDTIVVRQLVMILILAFGHSLNFFMAALGSFVHPLRLTFVEFYKNAGFMGGGKKYEPFKKY